MAARGQVSASLRRLASCVSRHKTASPAGETTLVRRLQWP